jgi:hypothetical protein
LHAFFCLDVTVGTVDGIHCAEMCLSVHDLRARRSVQGQCMIWKGERVFLVRFDLLVVGIQPLLCSHDEVKFATA